MSKKSTNKPLSSTASDAANVFDSVFNRHDRGVKLKSFSENPRDLSENPRDLSENPRDLSENPRDLSENPRDLSVASLLHEKDKLGVVNKQLRYLLDCSERKVEKLQRDLESMEGRLEFMQMECESQRKNHEYLLNSSKRQNEADVNLLKQASDKNTKTSENALSGENQVLLSLIDKYFEYNRESLKGVYALFNEGFAFAKELVRVSSEQEKQQFDKQFELELRKQRLEESRFEHEVALSAKKAANDLTESLKSKITAAALDRAVSDEDSMRASCLKWGADENKDTLPDWNGKYPHELSAEELYRRISKYFQAEMHAKQGPQEIKKRKIAWWKLAKRKSYDLASAPSPEHFETKDIKISTSPQTSEENTPPAAEAVPEKQERRGRKKKVTEIK